MDRSNIDKIAHTQEDRLLLAKVCDKIAVGIRRDIPTHSGFLSPRELALCRLLFGDTPGLHSFGGHAEAERRMLCYLPDYLDPSSLLEEDAPVVCLRATFYEGDSLTHRDFLGALMGAGVSRETIGDIHAGKGSCDLFVSADIAPYLLQSFTEAGRTKLRLSQIPLSEVSLPDHEIRQIQATLASLRLDSVISSGFRISRSLAAQHITAGRVAIDGLPCEKPDKQISEGAKLSLRGLGKICLASVNGQTKKGRISVVIHRYV